MHRQSRDKKKKVREKKGNKTEDKGETEPLEDIIVDEIPIKDFEFLVNAPITEDDHFVFKSEKTWSVDVSKYSEYFTVDLKTLSAAIESIPFNEIVNIDSKYFTSDQLTNIYNRAEKGKENYTRILGSSEVPNFNKPESKEESQESVEDITNDLDFLLSLQEPVSQPPIIVKALTSTYDSGRNLQCFIELFVFVTLFFKKLLRNQFFPDARSQAKSTPTKPIDLEKWLDSVLDT